MSVEQLEKKYKREFRLLIIQTIFIGEKKYC